MSYIPPIPLVWYNFNYNNNTKVVNKGYVGYTMDGVLMNNATCINTDYAVNGISLNLTNTDVSSSSLGQYISIPSFVFGGSGFLWSFSCWFKKQSSTISQTSAKIFDFSSGRNGINTCSLGFFNNTGFLYFSKNDNLSNEYMITAVNTCDNNWHHVVITYDGIFFNIYLDNSNILTTILNPIDNIQRDVNYIGRSSYDNDYYSSIIIDDFKLYSNYCLSVTDINYLYQLRPVIRYDFEYNDTNKIMQNMGTLSPFTGQLQMANPGYIVLDTICAVGTLSANLYRSGSVGGYVNMSYTFTYGNTETDTGYSICFWYNKNTMENNSKIFDFSNGINTQQFTCYFSNTGNLVFYKTDSNGTDTVTILSNSTDGIWRHVAIVFDSVNLNYLVYLNGVLVLNTTGTRLLKTERIYNYIGKSVNSADNYFTGYIDDIILYNIPLSHYNILNIVNKRYSYFGKNPSLLNLLFKPYLPTTTLLLPTGMRVFLGNNSIDINRLFPLNNNYNNIIINNTISYTKTNYTITGFNPIMLLNCCNYYSADIGINSLPNGSILTWKDQSGNNYTVSQPIDSYKVSYNPIGLNNLPALSFDGTTKYMGFKSINSVVLSYTIFFVVSRNKNGSTDVILTNSYSSGYPRTITIYDGNGGGGYGLTVSQYSSITVTSPSVIDSDVPYLACITFDYTSITIVYVNIYINGTLVKAYSKSSSVSTGVDFSNFTFNNYNYGFKGCLSSAIIYNRLLSSTEIQQTEGYLTWKWWGSGESILPNTHPYYSIPPLYELNIITSVGTCVNYFSADIGFKRTSSNTVSQWSDLSSNRKNATQTTTIYQPTYQKTSLINNKPCVLFGNTSLTFNSGISTTQTIFIVACYYDISQTNMLIRGNGTTNGSGYIAISNTNLFTYDNNIISTTINNTSLYNFSNNVPFIVCITLDNSTSTILYNSYINGLFQNSNTVSSTQHNIANATYSFNSSIDNLNLSAGISSTLIYNTILTTPQRQIIEGYLAWKWWDNGSILPYTHPFYDKSPYDIGMYFSTRSLNMFLPKYIVNLYNYYSADNGVTQSNNLISSWSDISNNNYTATQLNTLYQPTYNTTGFNGYQTISYSSSILNATSTNNSITYFSILFVLSFNILTQTNNLFYSTGSIIINITLSYNNPNYNLNVYINNINTGSITYNFNTTTPYIILLTVNNITNSTTWNISLYINGTLITSYISSDVNTSFVQIPGFQLGGNSTNSFNLSSFLLYNQDLSLSSNTIQRQQLEGYLAWKWWGNGSILPILHPYYSIPP